MYVSVGILIHIRIKKERFVFSTILFNFEESIADWVGKMSD